MKALIVFLTNNIINLCLKSFKDCGITFQKNKKNYLKQQGFFFVERSLTPFYPYLS